MTTPRAALAAALHEGCQMVTTQHGVDAHLTRADIVSAALAEQGYAVTRSEEVKLAAPSALYRAGGDNDGATDRNDATTNPVDVRVREGDGRQLRQGQPQADVLGILASDLPSGSGPATGIAALAEQGYAVTRSEAGLGRRQLMAAWKFYADRMNAYAVASGLDREQYAAVMVDVRHARAEYARLAADPDEATT